MSTYLFAYRMPQDYRPGAADVAADWNRWFTVLGESLLDAGNPVFTRGAVGDAGADSVLGGYSLVQADDLESALALAEGCPSLQSGGGVEVGELTMLNPESLATTVADHARATQLAG